MTKKKGKFTKGSYWGAYDTFWIYSRSNEEHNDKYKRMKAIADEKEYQDDEQDNTG